MRVMQPRISVLLPVRDAADTVAEAVESVLGQTLDALELVVVDDGSRDGTAEILRGLARTDPRVVLVETPPRGLVPALRAAAARARAPFLARMDADDRSHPRRLARQLAWLERRPELGAVGCLVRTISDPRCTADGWERYERWLNGRRTAAEIRRDLFVESPLAHPSVTLRREAYEGVGGYRAFDGPEDYDLWLRLAAAGWDLAKVPAVLLDWRDRPDRLTRRDPRYRLEAFLRLKAQHLSRGPLAGLEPRRPVWIWGAGRLGRQLCRELEREGAGGRVAAFVDIDPRKIGGERRGRPVLPRVALRERRDVAVLAAVPVVGARALIRRQLTGMGFCEGVDYWCCA
jgi:cellulose synthase/poly-beta-1,6-N-acetylglucosamine synthase-like glycosyltransferase